MKIFHLLNKVLRNFKFQIKQYPNSDLRRRFSLMKKYNIDFVFDVGANKGQYAKELIFNKYYGDVHSFEPLSEEFAIITRESKYYKNWKVYNYALGEKSAELTINVSKNKVSSSILPLTNEHLNAASESIVIGTQNILVNRLDDVMKNFNINKRNLMLKIDTQGYEYNVLLGAGDYLEKFQIIQIELSLRTMYRGEKNYLQIIEFLSKYNFRLASIEPGFYDEKSGELLQFDGIFCKTQTR
jgi:FkbM family methyltransferase